MGRMSIEVTGVTRFFGPTRAVWQMNMTVPKGTVTGLVGSNGAGKTTLLLMLAALLAPDAGSIRIAGLDPAAQPRQVHQAVGWMPDSFGTWDSLTCTEILLTFAAAQGLDKAMGKQRAIDMLSAVHLEEMAHTPARVLSRGQKQRLGLARALVHRPKVLLLDEPAAGMDPRSRADLRVLLRDLAASGVTVLVSSHILSELEQMVDGVIFMAHGQAIAPASASSAQPRPDGGDGAGDAEHTEDTDDAESTESTDGADDPAAPKPDSSPTPGSNMVRPQPLQRQWQMRALDAQRLSDWSAEASVRATTTADGTVRLAVPDDAAAARVLREALNAGVEVVSFAPTGGALEEIYLSMEGDRR